MERREIKQREMLTIENKAEARAEALRHLVQTITKEGWKVLSDEGFGDDRVITVEREKSLP